MSKLAIRENFTRKNLVFTRKNLVFTQSMKILPCKNCPLYGISSRVYSCFSWWWKLPPRGLWDWIHGNQVSFVLLLLCLTFIPCLLSSSSSPSPLLCCVTTAILMEFTGHDPGMLHGHRLIPLHWHACLLSSCWCVVGDGHCAQAAADFTCSWATCISATGCLAWKTWREVCSPLLVCLQNLVFGVMMITNLVMW